MAPLSRLGFSRLGLSTRLEEEGSEEDVEDGEDDDGGALAAPDAVARHLRARRQCFFHPMDVLASQRRDVCIEPCLNYHVSAHLAGEVGAPARHRAEEHEHLAGRVAGEDV